ERLKCDWNSPIYAFFPPMPTIEYVGGHRLHVFKCTSKGCKKTVCQFLDKGDAHSTGNLHRHVKTCWGEDPSISAARSPHVGQVATACEAVKNYAANGSITTAFERKNKSVHLFEIVNDTGFQCLMKMGRPEYYLPKPAVVSCDVQNMFVQVQQQLAEKLQAYDSELNFATDTWTAPNHKSFAAVTVHLEDKGEALGPVRTAKLE
ncbi:hypothetical protein SCLCIDRAFT_117037, partial [Scleroderma citrinum Foug A]